MSIRIPGPIYLGAVVLAISTSIDWVAHGDTATLVGFELLADQDFCSWLTGFAWVSYAQGDDRSRPEPSRIGSLLREQLQYDPNAPRSFVDGVEKEPLPGFTILNARAYWRPRQSFALFGGVENMGDRFYREHLDFRSGRGLYRPGVNFYLLAEVQY